MNLFSHRKGLKPIKIDMQIDSMDSDLRNGSWNILTIYFWDKVETEYDFYLNISSNNAIVNLIKLLWHEYFKKPLDTINKKWSITITSIRSYFYKCEWYEAYDFLEFIAQISDKSVASKFTDACNIILKRDLSAYRFIGGKITQITSEEEIAEIEEALESTKPFKNVATHIKRAFDMLSDRKSPDYRNSIKESISAVEAICNSISKNNKATLGQALKEIEKKVELHPALKKAFDSLYGYTSDAEGIRHALLDEPNLDFEDAKFMLVSCSAFINYLKTKSSKIGLKL